MRARPIQYQFEPIESKEKKELKTEMRIKDFYEKFGQSNRFIILPDPSLPKPANGHPIFTILNSNIMHGKTVRKYKNTLVGGDAEHGTTIQFFKDMNAPFLRKLQTRNNKSMNLGQSASLRENKDLYFQNMRKMLQEDEESDEETRAKLKKENGNTLDIKNYLEKKKRSMITQHLVKNINKKLQFEKKCSSLENNT